MKHSRSKSVSRVSTKVKHITIDDFLPSEEAQPRNEPVPTVIDLSSDFKNHPLSKGKAVASASKPKSRRPSFLRGITLESIQEGAEIFVIRRKKKISMKYYWKNSELLKLYVVSISPSNPSSLAFASTLWRQLTPTLPPRPFLRFLRN